MVWHKYFLINYRPCMHILINKVHNCKFATLFLSRKIKIKDSSRTGSSQAEAHEQWKKIKKTPPRININSSCLLNQLVDLRAGPRGSAWPRRSCKANSCTVSLLCAHKTKVLVPTAINLCTVVYIKTTTSYASCGWRIRSWWWWIWRRQARFWDITNYTKTLENNTLYSFNQKASMPFVSASFCLCSVSLNILWWWRWWSFLHSLLLVD